MAKNKKEEQKKRRILTRARDLYSAAACSCGTGADKRGGVINCTVAPASRQIPTKYSPKEIDGGDLQDLMRLLSMKRGGGATVDVDSEGNLVWRKPAAETSYGGGVGRIGRIDEEKPCCFSEADVSKFRYCRSVSGGAIDRGKVLAYDSKI